MVLFCSYLDNEYNLSKDFELLIGFNARFFGEIEKIIQKSKQHFEYLASKHYADMT